MYSDKSTDGGKCCVLVVDDDGMVLGLMRRILEQAGYQVFAYSSAVGALSCLETHSFDVALLDIRMPDIDGLELFAVIQKRWPELAGRTGFVTGNVPADEVQILVSRFNRPVLLKPFTYEDLEHFVHNLAMRNADLHSPFT